MKKHLLSVILCFLSPCIIVAQKSIFVNQSTGSDSNSGLNEQSSFQSMDAATDLALPGDTIFIIGEYSNASFNPNFSYTNNHDPHLWHSENSVRINDLHGKQDSLISLKAFDGSTILKGDGANIFRVTNSSYLHIEGFNIQGQVDAIPLSVANQLQFAYLIGEETGDPLNPLESEIQYRDEDCVNNCVPDTVVEGEIYTNLKNKDIIRPSYIDTRGLYLSNVHHITIASNVIHHMPGGGLRVSDCEDIDIIGNEVHNCSRKSYSGTHALVVTKATSTRSGDDYRIRIERNKIHHNFNEQFSWAPTKTVITPHIDEGKGISLQRNETTYDNGGTINVNWENGRILVANNLCYFNGFSGVHSNDGNRIDFFNNTVYFNSYTKSITENISTNNGGNIGISAQGGSDIRIINNISIIDVNLNKSAISSNLTAEEGLVVRNNLIYGTTLEGEMGPISEDGDIVAVQENTIMADPHFAAPLDFNFQLEENSPAIGAADISFAPAMDFNEQNRDNEPDLGAFEFVDGVGIVDTTPLTWSIYPNPSTGTISINLSPSAPLNYTIHNAVGSFVQEGKVENGKIHFNHEAPGVYFITIGEKTNKFILK